MPLKTKVTFISPFHFYRALSQLVDFMYAGILRVDHDGVCDVLQAADLLLMERVRSACIKFLQQTISAENCVVFRQLGHLYACPGIWTCTFWLTIQGDPSSRGPV